jgi:hypothetical protein
MLKYWGGISCGYERKWEGNYCVHQGVFLGEELVGLAENKEL